MLKRKQETEYKGTVAKYPFRSILSKCGYGLWKKPQNSRAILAFFPLRLARILKEYTRKSILQQSHKNSRVVIIAGGQGTRLGKRTSVTPKPMLTLAGAPMLEHIVRHVGGCGFTNFLFKTHYRSEVIEQYFERGEKHGVHISYFVEHEPMGTAGGLSFLKNESAPVIVAYGDVLFNIDPKKLLAYHTKHEADVTAVVFISEHPEDSDICVVENERITRMIHKPGTRDFGSLANAALYIFEPKCFEEIPEIGSYDLDRDFLPRLIEKNFVVRGYRTRIGDYIEDAGTPERFAKVEQYLTSKKFLFATK